MDTSNRKVRDAVNKFCNQYGPGLERKAKVPLKKTATSSAGAQSKSSFATRAPRTRMPSTSSAYGQFAKMEDRLTKDLHDHYESLSGLRKRIHDMMRRERVIQDYCDYMTDYNKVWDTYYDMLDVDTDEDDDAEDDDDEDFNPMNAYSRLYKNKLDGYTFFTHDAKGVHYKSLETKPGVPFRIEIDVKGFEPGDIKVDSRENQMTIKMKQEKASTSTDLCEEKTLGIICPTVEDLDKLNIHYPQNDILLIEGPLTPIPSK